MKNRFSVKHSFIFMRYKVILPYNFVLNDTRILMKRGIVMFPKIQFICTMCSFLLISNSVFSQNSSNATVDLLTTTGSDRKFSEGAVDSASLDLILKSGINAPSARNHQPWRFSVLKETQKTKKLISNIKKGNVIIIVSGTEDASKECSVDFDCALATENMFIAAKSLGLAARIYTGPIPKVKKDKDSYKVPDGYRPVAILRIGNSADDTDATTSASTKKSFSEIVN